MRGDKGRKRDKNKRANVSIMNIENIKFKVGHESVAGTLFHPENPNGSGVLFFHGWNSSREGYVERAKSICELGYYCLTIDSRGFGESDAEISDLSIRDHLKDAVGAYDFMKEKANIIKISACGASYGGFLSVMLSGRRNLNSIVMRAPGIYQDRVFELTDWTEEWLLLDEIYKFKSNIDFNDSEAIKNLKKFKGYLLVVGSKNDEKIPEIVVESYYNSAVSAKKRELLWMKNVDHALSKTEYQEQYISILVDWFERLQSGFGI